MDKEVKFFVFSVDAAGKDVFVARDGGLTPDIGEADVNTEDVADDLSVLATTEYDMIFGIGHSLG